YTYLVAESDRAKWKEFVLRKIGEGRQAYWIVPLVEESFTYPGRSLDAVLTELRETIPPEIRIGSLHGRMGSTEKESVMNAFRCGEIQILVSTTVVEVGVDVPNATLMTIESGDCFGLSQLHQLRGRIVRGTHPGYCGVFAKTEPEGEAAGTTSETESDGRSGTGSPGRSRGGSREMSGQGTGVDSGKGSEVRRRIEAFVRSTDGFELAEVDFELRGPGDMVGTRQHGLPGMFMADLIRDREILEETRRDAAEILSSDPELTAPSHALLHRKLSAKYRTNSDLADTG
ncbi:MAG: helicase-related protein, partial [Planctomycetia bacterium]|nr:helicase-related protein [Planctomycetia bacterium]